ncbi:hypothetical protein CCMA1212_007111 [Trichoderma ghanense]|uniref:Uncharacterized protein n=1 Tax=Trichoderma ghanense TaxID=65468 RepID=A0ABY2GYB8_9HYPO
MPPLRRLSPLPPQSSNTEGTRSHLNSECLVWPRLAHHHRCSRGGAEQTTLLFFRASLLLLSTGCACHRLPAYYQEYLHGTNWQIRLLARLSSHKHHQVCAESDGGISELKGEREWAAESERQAQFAGRCHRPGVTNGAAKWKFCRAMGARDFVYPRNWANRCRSGFACPRWSGESAWVAFEGAVGSSRPGEAARSSHSVPPRLYARLVSRTCRCQHWLPGFLV